LKINDTGLTLVVLSSGLVAVGGRAN